MQLIPLPPPPLSFLIRHCNLRQRVSRMNSLPFHRIAGSIVHARWSRWCGRPIRGASKSDRSSTSTDLTHLPPGTMWLGSLTLLAVVVTLVSAETVGPFIRRRCYLTFLLLANRSRFAIFRTRVSRISTSARARIAFFKSPYPLLAGTIAISMCVGAKSL